MRQSTILSSVVLACAVVLSPGWGTVYGEDKAEKKVFSRKDVRDMMAKAHKGEKSPYANLMKELKAETPDWTKVGADVKVLSEMAEMLGATPEIYTYHYEGGPWRYLDSAKALDKAARDNNQKAAVEALTGLTKSCSSCHSYRASK